MKVISLGWGVQSWTLAAMVALGKLPPIDFAIHGDTGWERSYTYEFAAKWTPWLENHGVRVVTVKSESSGHILDHTNRIYAPLYTRGKKENIGQLRRYCTGRWKITPIRRYIYAELRRRRLKREPGCIEQWLGITTDEIARAKDSDVQYVVNRYPLLDLGFSRDDCLKWLKSNNLPSPGKSSCTFCPYHNSTAWKEMRKANDKDWQEAVMIDESIRNKSQQYSLFVHRSAIPLVDAVNVDQEYQQLSLINEECDSGYCFL